MIIVTDNECVQYSYPGHPECPNRITRTIQRLKNQQELKLSWQVPLTVEDPMIFRAHSPEHLTRLSRGIDFDADTPAYPKIFHHARQSVGSALRALQAAREGQMAFSLIRPPGHHAERERAMGFCYLNQTAIASLEALANGFKEVAVYDFDVHHGNGTENILFNHPNCSFFSIHQHPCYPGTGTCSRGNCHNYPVPPHTPRQEYRSILAQALKDLQCEKPDLVAVSAGFDAYRGDPLSNETLEMEDFHWLGKSIRKLGIPCFCVLEGGYSNDLPELIFTFLKGLDGC